MGTLNEDVATNEKIPVTIRVDAETYAKLTKCAEEQNRSLSNMGVWAIIRYLQLYEKNNG